MDYNASNNNIVKNYFINNLGSGEQDPNLTIWDKFFDIGDPNRQVQQLKVNYNIPTDKIPTFDLSNQLIRTLEIFSGKRVQIYLVIL